MQQILKRLGQEDEGTVESALTRLQQQLEGLDRRIARVRALGHGQWVAAQSDAASVPK